METTLCFYENEITFILNIIMTMVWDPNSGMSMTQIVPDFKFQLNKINEGWKSVVNPPLPPPQYNTKIQSAKKYRTNLLVYIIHQCIYGINFE